MKRIFEKIEKHEKFPSMQKVMHACNVDLFSCAVKRKNVTSVRFTKRTEAYIEDIHFFGMNKTIILSSLKAKSLYFMSGENSRDEINVMFIPKI